MDEKTNLRVMFGGASSEHEVSCVSAASVLQHISEEKYNIYKTGITKEGNWFLTSSPVVNISDGSWENDENNRRIFILPDRGDENILVENEDGTYEKLRVDVVFPVLHGKNGEDGTMQGLLQIAGIPFVGSEAAASAASMDKAVTKAVISQHGIVAQAECCVAADNVYADRKRGGCADNGIFRRQTAAVREACQCGIIGRDKQGQVDGRSGCSAGYGLRRGQESPCRGNDRRPGDRSGCTGQ